MSLLRLWQFLPVGYFFTVLIETPVLLVGLSRRYSWRQKLLAGFWLTACTYPIVVLVMPPLLVPWAGRNAYLAVAETFAPLAECLLFRAAFSASESANRRVAWRDYAVIVLANLLSFGAGELWYWLASSP